MLGRPIESGDVVALTGIALAVMVVCIARFAQLVKPAPDWAIPPSPETVARVSRNMRTSMTFAGVALGLGALGILLLHRVPDWAHWSVIGLQLVASGGMFLQVFRARRQRRRPS